MENINIGKIAQKLALKKAISQVLDLTAEGIRFLLLLVTVSEMTGNLMRVETRGNH